MSETVFILGAGASMHAGAPDMRTFLDVANRLRRTKAVPDGAVGTAFDRVLRGRAALDPVFAKASIDTDDLEAVFGAFEMAQLFGQFEGFSAEEISALPIAMKTVIVETLEQTVRFPFNGNEGRSTPKATSEYETFATMLSEMLKRSQSVSVITFNYDVALDLALVQRRVSIDHCLKDHPEHLGVTKRIDLMKLHGSVNWTVCPGCGVVPLLLEDYFKERSFFGHPSGPVRLELRQALLDFKHACNSAKGDGAPVIVPPTWNKAAGHHAIEKVWRRAVRHLRDARNIIVIGYSLPSSDQFFRYLYALGTVSATRLERFWLIDPDARPTRVVRRFRRLLGKVAERRFYHQPNKFEKSVIDWLGRELYEDPR